jgi:hypothetical protein
MVFYSLLGSRKEGPCDCFKRGTQAYDIVVLAILLLGETTFPRTVKTGRNHFVERHRLFE